LAFHGGKNNEREEVLARVDEVCGRPRNSLVLTRFVPLVELTGGEPLLQGKEIYPLAEALACARMTVMIENQRRTVLSDGCPKK